VKKNKNILVSPLDWGLGHATRCVPIIRLLIEHEANVFLGASGATASFLRSEFPDLPIIQINGYQIRYPASGSMTREMLRQSLSILRTIRQEHQELQKIVREYDIHAVISDNRFGLWSSDTYNIYISHQIRIKAYGIKVFENILFRLHRRYINKFDECWIPDIAEMPGLSGALSHPADGNYYYVGPLSRFNAGEPERKDKPYDLMVIMSGPEPQRSIFEKIVLDQLKTSRLKAIVVLGKPGKSMEVDHHSENIEVYPHLSTGRMQEAMLSSRLILCRPGYSSIMDLSKLGLKAAFVPTPGQTEQEYLASLHKKAKHYYAIPQKDFNLDEVIRLSNDYTGIKLKDNNNILVNRIEHLLSRLK
jgi:uncharacterized protein (TIGR00661 family)